MSLKFADDKSQAKVVSVDTGTVFAKVLHLEDMQKFAVNKLVAINGRAGEYLIGLVSKLTRISEKSEDDGMVCNDNIRISLIGTYKTVDGKKKEVFKRSLDSIPQIEASCWAIEGTELSVLMQVISNSSSQESNALTIGEYTLDETAKAYLNGDKFFQKHAVIVGSTGSGKSWTTALILEQVASLKNSSAIIFDIHGEYSSMKGDGFSHFKIAGPNDLKKTIKENILFLPYWLLPYEAIIKMFVDRSDQNAPNQAAMTSTLVKEHKLKFISSLKNKEDYEKNFTVDSPIYFDIHALLKELEALDVQMVPGKTTDKQGPFHGKFTRFITRLENKITDNRLGFMFQGGEETKKLEYLENIAEYLIGKTKNGVRVINFSEVPSDILPLMVAMVARLIFSLQQWSLKELRDPVAIFCDEAHNYIQNITDADSSDEFAVQIFEKIAKEGRKFGVGLVVISQRPAEVSKTVLSQCGNFIAMRLTNAEDQHVIQRLLPDNLSGTIDALPVLDVGEALVVGDACLLPSRIKIFTPKNEPLSSTVDFWTEWNAKERKADIKKASDNWRKQIIS